MERGSHLDGGVALYFTIFISWGTALIQLLVHDDLKAEICYITMKITKEHCVVDKSNRAEKQQDTTKSKKNNKTFIYFLACFVWKGGKRSRVMAEAVNNPCWSCLRWKYYGASMIKHSMCIILVLRHFIWSIITCLKDPICACCSTHQWYHSFLTYTEVHMNAVAVTV